jgi:manganese transport protein
VLSFGIPVALVPLVVMTSSKKIMGEQVNGRLVTVLAYAVAAGITLMNGFLIFQQIAG